MVTLFFCYFFSFFFCCVVSNAVLIVRKEYMKCHVTSWSLFESGCIAEYCKKLLMFQDIPFQKFFPLYFFYLFCTLLFLIASKAFLIVPWFWHSVFWRFLHYPLQTNLSAMQEDLLATLESKNPSVKEETVRFLTRSFCKSTPASLPKTFLKPTCGSLLKVRGIL